MDTTQFLQNIKETLEIEGRELSLTDHFREYEEWDSLAYLSTIAMIDDEYSIVFDSNDFKTLETWNDVIAAIEARS